MMRSLVLLLMLLNILLCSHASTETNTTNITEKSGHMTAGGIGDAKPAASSNNPSYAPAPSFLPRDFWRSGLGKTFSIGGITITLLMLIAGVTWLFAPFSGLRMCNLIGNCEKTTIPYNNGGNLQDLNVQSSLIDDAQYIHSYNGMQMPYYKRSVDIVNPIFKNVETVPKKFEQMPQDKSKNPLQ